jgi:DnaJ-class molecular chaperone
MREYYQLLGVNETSSKDEVKHAFKKLAQYYHPDKPTGDTEKFKQIKQAYDYIIKNFGKYKSEPKPQTQPPKATPAHDAYWYTSRTWTEVDMGQKKKADTQVRDVTISFGDLFGNSQVEIPGTGFYIKPPYGVTEGSQLQQVAKTLDGREQCTVTIKYHIEDPTGFYSQRVINGVNCLYCKVHVTTGMVLSGFDFSLRNINPNLDGFSVKASTKSLLCIPHVGLPGNRQSRGNLYVEQIIELKQLEDEIYPVLLALQKRVKEMMDDKSYNQHIK